MRRRKWKQERRRRRREKIKAFFSKIGTLNIVLGVVFIIFLWFNYKMLQIYVMVGSIPESYACAVVAALLGECGFCGWIRTNKDRHREHKWELEDKEKQQNNGDLEEVNLNDEANG